MPTIPGFVEVRKRYRGVPWGAAAFLLLIHAATLLAGFLSPYDYAAQHRMFPFAPPTRIHFVDQSGRFHLRPFVYQIVPRSGNSDDYGEESTRRHPVHFFVREPEQDYPKRGISHTHFFATDEDAPIFLLGTDSTGRDVFSRLLFGGRISLNAGLAATAIALSLSITLGLLAGYADRLCDSVIMRAAEVFLAVPGLYLLLAVRAVLPLRIDPENAFAAIVVVLGVIGWARPTRLIRGVALSAREREYVLAARSFGPSGFYLVRVHIVPQIWSVVAAQAGVLIPQYILAEVTLSFFGLGVGEPIPSWGNMLAAVQSYFVLQKCWWMFAPAAVLIVVLLAYQRILGFLLSRVPAS